MAAKHSLQGPGSVAYRMGQGVGGIDADFVSTMPPDYECPICHLAFRDPMQTRDCGHRFCETCIEPILRLVFRFTLKVCVFTAVVALNLKIFDCTKNSKIVCGFI